MNQIVFKTPRILYLAGLLCFIPLFGVFVGFTFILFGSIKYRDKYLVLIGIAGILFTASIYSPLIYLAHKDSSGNKDWIPVTRMGLNECVKSIEFYKLEHGSYPVSLNQINDSLTMIFDTYANLKSKKGTPAKYFQYMRIDTNYTLYSIGPDLKANTLDDLYPSVDTNMTGFKIRRIY